jgi:hypothetical protein
MLDKYPQISPETRERKPSTEQYELPSGDVLVRVTFTMDEEDDVQAHAFMYVFKPTPTKKFKEMEEKVNTIDPEKRDVWKDALTAQNSVLVFETEKQRREWFEGTKYNFEQEEQDKISNFLHL